MTADDMDRLSEMEEADDEYVDASDLPPGHYDA